MYDDVTTRNESGELAVRTVSATEGSNTSSYDDVFTRTTDGKLAMRVVGNGGGGGGAVSSVNGKTGAVVLNAEDVGALPEDTPIPDPQVQSDWDQTDPEAVDYIKNKPVIPQGGIPQYDTMPTASADNVGEIAQYSGESIADSYQNGYFYKSSAEYSDPSATISQTVGSSLTDLSVNVDTFIEAEQPTQSGNTSFVASVIEDNLDLVGQAGWVITVDSSAIINRIKQEYPAFDFNDFVEGWINYQESTGDAIMGFRDSNTSYQISLAGITFSIVVRGEGLATDYVNVATVVGVTVGSTTWSKNGTTVDLAEYGISYSEKQNDVTLTPNPNNTGSGSLVCSSYSVFASAPWLAGYTLGVGASGTITKIHNPDDQSQDDWQIDFEGNVYYAGSDTAAFGVEVVGDVDYGDSFDFLLVEVSLEDGDTLTVAYTAPTPIGYSWKQTDVQPSSGSGIEWQEPIIMTKPAGDTEWKRPYVHLGSESGRYSFYVKVLRLTNGNGAGATPENSNTLGYMTYKISFDYDSTKESLYEAITLGSIGIVFDGETGSGFTNTNPIKSYPQVLLKKARDGTVWVSVNDVLQSDAFLYMSEGETEKIAQFSEVYKDGEIVNAECFIDNQYFWETIDSIAWSDYSRNPLVEIPTHYWRQYVSWFASDINTRTQFLIGGGYDTTEIYVSAESNGDRFVGKLYRKSENEWEQEILMADGNFASWEFKRSGSNPIIYFGETPPTFTETVYVNVGAFGIGNINDISLYFDTSPVTSVPMVRDGKSYRFLTPTASMIGGIHQYIGPTNANYTNGYYYKANGTVVVVPASITTNVTSPAGEATVTIDVDNFVNALNQGYGWSKEQIIQWFKDYRSGWNLHYDIANNIIDRLNVPWHGDITDSSILQYVSVTYTGTETTDITIIFDETYAPESKVVQNPSWDRVDVQPLDLTGVAGYDATKTQVLKNVQGTLTWVDE